MGLDRFLLDALTRMLMVSDLVEVARGGPAPAAAPRGAPVVVWNVCRHCNMTCAHCCAGAVTTPAPGDLRTDEALRVIDALADGGVKVITFSGGEPLLRTDLFELLTRARERRITAHLSTNGSLVDAQVARRLAATGVVYVGVSVDGLAAFNDAYRGMAGAHALAMRALRACREAGLETGLRLTLTRRNVDQLEPLVERARELGVDRCYLSHLLHAGRLPRIGFDHFTPVESRAALERTFAAAERLLEAGAKPRLIAGGNDSAGPALLLWVARRHGAGAAARVRDLLAERGGNRAAETVIAVDPRGRVRPGQFWTGTTLGSLRTEPLAKILAQPLRAALRDRTARLGGRCGTCVHQPLCRGSHRERALAAHGDLWAPDPACVLTDEEAGDGLNFLTFAAGGR